MPGQAPPVGIENEERARENILAKLALIKAWVKKIEKPDDPATNEPLVALAAVPKSQRAFNAWQSIDLPSNATESIGLFHRNSNATLLKNVEIETLRSAFQILKQAQESGRKNPESTAGLHRRLAMERTLRRIAEKELTRARAQVWKAREELESLRAEVVSTEAYAAATIEKLEGLLKEAASERAELARVLNKVVGIQQAKK